MTKFTFSAIMTFDVTQKRGIFATISAKTALANYLLLLSRKTFEP